MSKANFIPLREFCDAQEICLNSIIVSRHEGRLPEAMFKKEKKLIYIDQNYALKRIEFRRKFWLTAHDLYYELMEVFPSQSSLARFICKLDGSQTSSDVWNVWLTSDLFCLLDDKGLKLEPRVKDYKFVRFARWLLAIHRRIGLNF